MIVADRKPVDEIVEIIDRYDKVLIVGCDSCVAVCHAGGEKEVGILAAQLRIKFQKDDIKKEILEATVERQCEWEMIEPILEKLDEADAILSMACGVGVNFLADKLKNDIVVLPALDTTFYGATEDAGIWTEKCAGCGKCILHLTGGICPIARCAKSILNGPCGGSDEGKCEVDENIDCAWQLIYDRLKALDQLENILEIQPIKDWSPALDGGPRKRIREDLRV
jgi:ferredoxin